MNVSNSVEWYPMPFAYTVLFTSFSALGTFCNLFLIICMVKDPLKAFRNPPSYLIMNLAVGDMETCIAQFVVHILLLTGNKYMTDLLYRQGLILCGPDLSLMSLVFLAVERYFCIRKPIRFRIWFTNRKIACLVLLIWLVHFARIAVINYCLAMGIADLGQIEKYTLMMFIISILCCLVWNSATLFTIKQKESNLRQVEGSNGNVQTELTNNRFRAQRKFVVTLVILTCCFTVSLVPFTVLISLHIARNDLGLPEALLDFSKLSYFMNFVINPFVYFWRMPRYRKSMLQVMSCSHP